MMADRLDRIEKRLYDLERLFLPSIMLQHRIELIESMITAEDYDEARKEINGTIRYLGDIPELHGLIARIDTIEFLKEHDDG